MDSITLDEALAMMNQVDRKGKPVPFSIEVPTCDLNRKRGGTRLIYEKAVLTNPGSRRQYRQYNGVINIRAVGNKEVRSIHPILIKKVNGKTITL
ncbi:hypothetical protein KHS38_12125 [Mucilaginibacter sp. Bleaf8]|uniref:hypothetical protein n=1 Tax=Mucilaginibacter sp. Bleaf8 TaxID=2834430 RepID=UPI001BCDDC25|nr:hypothetical protein [Mucilaginibacter sp. Bleaf8]MBS7565152.1 hypothetical protein [Mucilaginibacter sp. Bleaf8]